MLQNLTKGKMVEWVVLLVALVALGLSIAAVAKPCKSDFGDFLSNGKPGTKPVDKMGCYGVTNGHPCYGATVDMVCEKGATCVNNACVNADKSPIGEQTCGSSNSGQPECCNLDSGCSSTAHGGDLQCVSAPDGSHCSKMMGRSGFVCQPGGHSPLKCTKMGNPCRDTDDPPCCRGLECNRAVNECVQKSPGGNIKPPINAKHCEEITEETECDIPCQWYPDTNTCGIDKSRVCENKTCHVNKDCPEPCTAGCHKLNGERRCYQTCDPNKPDNTCTFIGKQCTPDGKGSGVCTNIGQTSGGKKGLIGGGGSTYNPDGSSNGDFPPNGFGGGGTPSPPSSPSPSPSPSPPSLKPDFPKFVFMGNKCVQEPKGWVGTTYNTMFQCEKASGLIVGPGGQDSHQEHDDGGKISSDLPLILGLSGGALVIVLAIVFLLIKKSKIKLK